MIEPHEHGEPGLPFPLDADLATRKQVLDILALLEAAREEAAWQCYVKNLCMDVIVAHGLETATPGWDRDRWKAEVYDRRDEYPGHTS